MFMTRYVRPEPVYENCGPELLVERAGYISPKKQIEQFMLAGKRLEASRREMYDFPDGEDNGTFDVTRSPNFDMADASMLARPAVERVSEAIEETKAEKRAKHMAEKKEFDEWKNSKNSKKEESEEGSE